ncbi:MAG TPA: TolC family protein, partial [Pseudobdellovibrionaceae bacterium]|nr:TolC family protein [Pseudobdellovibrionaceae bacterium]
MRTLILCLCVLFFGSVRADEGCGRHVKKYQDLLSCVEEKSPEIEGVRLETERARSQVGEAGQWKNPELSADSFHGKSGGFERSSTEISLGVPLELGGKRSARAAAAQSGLSAAEVKLSLVRSKVRAEAVLKLHRLRQVLHERDLMDEAIGTFERLVNQYRKRPGLSPEQRTSLSVYQLVKGEYELQKVAAGDEILAIETFFRLQAGLASEKLKSFLPASPIVWPTMGRESSNAASPVQRLLRAEGDLASAEL